jgi:hypothetical protein
MEKYKPYLMKPNRDTGSPRNFEELRTGYQVIDRYRKTLANAETAPMYSAGGYNQDGEAIDIEENLAPWDAVEKAADALAQSQAAVRILQAQKFTLEQLSPEGGVVIRNAEGEVVRSREIPVFIRATGRDKTP